MALFPIIFWTVIVLVIAFWLFHKFVFMRDPAREIPPGNTVCSPADGDVRAIIDISKKEWTEIPKGRWGKIKTLCKDVPHAKYLVLIVMNVWHVHVNRAPIQGRIMKVKHTRGRFANAVKDAASFPTIENENTEILYKSPQLSAKTVQIAGFVARRIESFVKKGDRILKGQRIGRILMGSQVALILPDKVKLSVKLGDAVKAGESVIGKW